MSFSSTKAALASRMRAGGLRQALLMPLHSSFDHPDKHLLQLLRLRQLPGQVGVYQAMGRVIVIKLEGMFEFHDQMGHRQRSPQYAVVCDIDLGLVIGQEDAEVAGG